MSSDILARVLTSLQTFLDSDAQSNPVVEVDGPIQFLRYHPYILTGYCILMEIKVAACVVRGVTYCNPKITVCASDTFLMVYVELVAGKFLIFRDRVERGTLFSYWNVSSSYQSGFFGEKEMLAFIHRCDATKASVLNLDIGDTDVIQFTVQYPPNPKDSLRRNPELTIRVHLAEECKSPVDGK